MLLTCSNPGVGAWTIQANILLKYIRPHLSILLWSLIWVSSYNLNYFYPLLFSPHQTNKGPNCLSISCSTLPSLIIHALKILDIFQSGQQFIPEKWCWWALHPFSWNHGQTLGADSHPSFFTLSFISWKWVSDEKSLFCYTKRRSWSFWCLTVPEVKWKCVEESLKKS